MKSKQKLNAEEKAILRAFETNKLRSISKLDAEKKRLQEIAKSHGIKNRRISLRMTVSKIIAHNNKT